MTRHTRWRSPAPAAWACAVLASVCGVSCAPRAHEPIAIELLTRDLAPTFRLSGTGTKVQLEVWGPYADAASLREATRAPGYAWRIWAQTAGAIQKSPSESPPIRYGELPPGWRRISESEPNAPPLVAGRYYRVSGGAIQSPKVGMFHEPKDLKTAALCLLAGATEVTEIPCEGK